MEPTALSLNQRRYVEAVIVALSHLAEAVAAIRPDSRVEAFRSRRAQLFENLSAIGDVRARNLGFCGHAPVAPPRSGSRFD